MFHFQVLVIWQLSYVSGFGHLGKRRFTLCTSSVEEKQDAKIMKNYHLFIYIVLSYLIILFFKIILSYLIFICKAIKSHYSLSLLIKIKSFPIQPNLSLGVLSQHFVLAKYYLAFYRYVYYPPRWSLSLIFGFLWYLILKASLIKSYIAFYIVKKGLV